MKPTLVAALVVALAGCASPVSHKPPPVIDRPVRHMLTDISLASDMAGVVSPLLFESSLCSKLFEYNKKQVSCPDELRALLQAQRDRAVVGATEGTELEALMSSQHFQRRVSLSAAKAGADVVVTVLVQDAKGNAVGRFQLGLASDGADVMDKAHEAAVQILSIP